MRFPQFIVATLGVYLAVFVSEVSATMPDLTSMPRSRTFRSCKAWAANQGEDAIDMWGTQDSGASLRELAISRLAASCMGDKQPKIIGFYSSVGAADAYCAKHGDTPICVKRSFSEASSPRADHPANQGPRAEPDDIKKLKAEAEGGSAEAMSQLANAYYAGNGVETDQREALYWTKKAADANNPMAMNNLGSFYEDGAAGLTKDDTIARTWYEKAAALGNGLAMKNLGAMYEEGRGDLPKDANAAFRWFKRGAEAGNARSMIRLGMLLREGKGTPQNAVEAYSWLKKAADDGDTLSMDMLGAMAMTGEGTAKDEQVGFSWFLRGADAGDASSMDDLSQAYMNGIGTSKNIEKGVEWIQKAAAGGAPRSEFFLGMFLETKNGPGDKRKAIDWYRKSANQGFQPAHDALSRLHASP